MQEDFDLHVYQSVVQYLIEQGCTFEDVEALHRLCPAIFQMDLDTLERKVTLLFNAATFHGLIICDKNDYQYYVMHQSSSSFQENDAQMDHIVKNVIDSVNKQYLQKIIGIQADDTLETKLFKMKQLKFNSSGYRVK